LRRIVLKIEPEKCREVANVIADLELKEDKFTDPYFYPPVHDSVEHVARFFFFVVAIDHRTRREGIRYEETIDGRKLRGSELLFRLSIIKYYSNREFFSPYNMSNIDVESLKAWLNYGQATIWDPEVRAYLLRDCAIKLLKLYEGSVSRIIEMSRGRLRGTTEEGLLDRLRVFRAYEDPVEKKSFLLVKFLMRRGIFTPIDLENLQVAVDNHLVRVAVRIGIVSLEEYEIPWFMNSADYEADIIVRMHVRKAYKLVAELSHIDPTLLDDLMWTLGRNYCLYGTPLCDNKQIQVLSTSGCPFRGICRAYHEKDLRRLNEHKYVHTWYY